MLIYKFQMQKDTILKTINTIVPEQAIKTSKNITIVFSNSLTIIIQPKWCVNRENQGCLQLWHKLLTNLLILPIGAQILRIWVEISMIELPK